jgi:hypothetical protein
MRFLKQFFLLFFVWYGITGCKDEIITPPDTTGKTNINVLFVGNSFTFYNNGVDFHLQKMLDADTLNDTTVNYSIQKIAVSSYTLQAHYQDSLTIKKIKSDKWNIVVLQEQSTRPINNPDLFLEYATKLDLEIKKINAKTVLYMTWAPKETPNDITTIAASYISVGSQIKAQVVPTGSVWDAFQKASPQINLYFSDNKHPSLAGTYLVSCAFYFCLFNKNPMNNTYLPVGISIQDATAIRKGVSDFIE